MRKILVPLLLCATISYSTAQKPENKTIIILPVAVRFESIATEKPYPPGYYNGRALSTEIVQAAIVSIKQAGATPVLADSIPGFYEALIPLANQLPLVFRRLPPASLMDSLGQLASKFGATGILVFDVLGRVGEDSGFNPFDTGWDHATHICRLRASIIRPIAPQLFWHQEAVGRFLPMPGSKKYGRLVDKLLKEFNLPN